jgi:hypothetical protein
VAAVKYKWKSTVPKGLYRVEAAVAGKEIKRLMAQSDGEITPARMVDAARPKSAPLHPAFEWDDKKAAEAHRRDQARGIMQACVEVRSVGGEDREVRVVIVAPVRTADGQRITRIATSAAMRDGEQSAYVLRKAFDELEAFQRKYAHLEAFAKVIDAIEEIDIVAEIEKAESGEA